MFDDVVRSIDVGYRNTKFCLGQDGGEYRYDMFPSDVACTPAIDMGAGFMSKRDIVPVEYQNKQYIVGRQVKGVLDPAYNRTMDEQFSGEPEYMALIYGALYYMGTPNIDLLMVGLPVHLMKSKASLLEERLKGKHYINSDLVVNINDVKAVPQPIGGFYYYSRKNKDCSERLSSQRTLIIDPGYFSLDWVLSENGQIMDGRSGGVAGGMKKVIDNILTQLDIESMHRDSVDEGLRLNNFSLEGKHIDVLEFGLKNDTYVSNSLKIMREKLVSIKDIQNVVLVGGGAFYFKHAVKEMFPNLDVHVLEDSHLCNVMGYQLIGLQALMRKRVAA